MIQCPNCKSLYWRYYSEGLEPGQAMRLFQSKEPADIIIARQFYSYWVWRDVDGSFPYRVLQSFMCNECKFVWRGVFAQLH